MKIVEIRPSDPEYAGALDLRYRLLRIPLGMPRGSEIGPYEESGRHFVALGKVSETLGEDVVIGCVCFVEIEAGVGKLFQMAVESHLQGQGLGRELVAALEAAVAADVHRVQLHARDIAVGFYEKLGYRIEGDMFSEVGIDHFLMAKTLAVDPNTGSL